MKSYTIR